MANSRRILKPFMGFAITVVNHWKYTAYNGTQYFESNDLKDLKRKIKGAEKSL